MLLSARASYSEHECFLVRANQIPTSKSHGTIFPALSASEHKVAKTARSAGNVRCHATLFAG